MARGFADMDPERHRAIAAQGGKAAQAKGKAHRFTPEEAKIAGKKGATECLKRHGVEHFRRLGQIGGKALAKKVGNEGMAERGRARHAKEET